MDNYEYYKPLVQALYGEVTLYHEKETRDIVAIKRMEIRSTKCKWTYEGHLAIEEDAFVERRVHRSLCRDGGHPYLLRLRDDFEHNGSMYLVFDYCVHGELYDVITKQHTGRLPVHVIQRYFTQIVLGLQFIHNNGYAHLDLSLENVLVDGNGDCKVCDLGLVPIREERKCTVGKMFYMAPEVLSGGKYMPGPADIWSLGIMLFILFTGIPPVESAAENDKRYQMIKAHGILGLVESWNMKEYFPTDVLDLLTHLLAADPSNRFDIDQVCQHPWVHTYVARNQEPMTKSKKFRFSNIIHGCKKLFSRKSREARRRPTTRSLRSNLDIAVSRSSEIPPSPALSSASSLEVHRKPAAKSPRVDAAMQVEIQHPEIVRSHSTTITA